MFARQTFRAAQPLKTVSLSIYSPSRWIPQRHAAILELHQAPSSCICCSVLGNLGTGDQKPSSSRTLLTLVQQYRRYATEPPASGGSNAFFYVGLTTVLGGGGAYYYYLNQAKVNKVAAKAGLVKDSATNGASAAKAFTGGEQGFISLKLESVENVNHNTKKFRFALPEKDQVSGLVIASAILTKFKGPNMEKPAIRPYTPVSDEGMEHIYR
jgi:hypothetical protein